MAHNIDMTNGRANIAYLGSRNDVWHKLGQEMVAGMDIEAWANAAGLEWQAVKSPAYVQVPEGIGRVQGECFITRNDNNSVLGRATDGYQAVQPLDILEWFQKYISADDRFALDVAGSLRGGKIIWATATYNGPIEVGGSDHVARILMSTSFDCTQATINKGTMTRVVCNNTLSAALADKRCEVRTRHNTKFNAKQVGKELAEIAKGFDQFKTVGDAMARQHMAKSETAQFLMTVLDIPHDANRKDISTRKMNQFQDLVRAYESTVAEGTEDGTAWTALNAVTRYVDHDRSTRGGADEASARFDSAQFGSGAALKAKAWNLLTHMEQVLGAEPQGVQVDLAKMEALLAN